ncbi:MAG: PD-(D/E)XK nuclease family protein [Halanaerobiaceae bacterium]
MLSNNINNLYFSQSALAIYEKCPLKFRRRYIDGLYWPQDWGGNMEQKEIIETGKRFHRLAQRYYARGEVMDAEMLSGELRHWFENLREFRPYTEQDVFYPEHEIRINKDGIKIVAKFDLLYLNKVKNKFIIYDWKTNQKPFSNKKDYSESMQSIVYLYVLAQAGSQYFPVDMLKTQDIGLTYWNPRFPGNVKNVKYSQRKFVSDKKFLINKINEIKSLSYDEFVGVNEEKICKYCEYRPICFNKNPELIEVEEDDLGLDMDWETIEEIQF